MRRILHPAVLALAIGVCAHAEPGTSPPAAGREDFFPLMAWDYATDEPTLEAMRDAGVNSVAFVPPAKLDACANFGLRAIVFDERVSGARWDVPFDADASARGLEALVREVGNHPAVWGYHLKDEPGAREYPALAKAAAAVKRLAPGKWPYINLLPGDGASYDKYVEDFLAICEPPILSYDRYVTTEDGGFSTAFWTNLEQIRNPAIRRGIPFHNIVLTAAHWHYREVTEADLRLQTFGSLAYGARGLGYYKFQAGSLPILNAPDLGNFRMAPLDEFGEKTPFWHSLRRVNRMILNLAPALLKLRSDDVYHAAPGSPPARCHGPTEKTLIKAVPDGEWIVGDFTHEDGSRWTMIVNRSHTRSAFCKPEFNGRVQGLEYVSPITGKLGPYPNPWYALAPGQGVLVKITSGN